MEGIILAAGFATRAKSNKMAFLLEDRTILERVIDLLYPFCSQIVVVGGHYYEEIKHIVKQYEKVKLVLNKEYPEGMFTSVKTGVSYVTEDFLLIPGDMPFIKPATVQKLIDETSSLIGVPVYNHKRGHPIYMKKELIPALLNESDRSNLKAFRDRYDISHIEVDDVGILEDVDTLHDYLELKKKYER